MGKFRGAIVAIIAGFGLSLAVIGCSNSSGNSSGDKMNPDKMGSKMSGGGKMAGDKMSGEGKMGADKMSGDSKMNTDKMASDKMSGATK